MTSMRVLLVEDHPPSRTLAAVVMRRAMHAVVEASSVLEARACLARDLAFDVALVDVGLPDGGGEAVLHAIRTTGSSPSMAVLAITAYAMAGDRDRLLAAGFDGYLSKPIDTRTFAGAVAALVDAKRAANDRG